MVAGIGIFYVAQDASSFAFLIMTPKDTYSMHLVIKSKNLI